jgi:hypothetical protein
VGTTNQRARPAQHSTRDLHADFEANARRITVRFERALFARGFVAELLHQAQA